MIADPGTNGNPGPVPTEPGVYVGLSFEDYLDIPAVNNSMLGDMDRSPAYMQMRRSEPFEPSDAMLMGTALHMLLLDGATKFTEAFAIAPLPEAIAPKNKRPKQTKAYRDAVARLAAQGRTVIDRDQYDAVVAMRDSLLDHPEIPEMIQSAQGHEVTVVWEQPVDRDRSVLAKCRFDQYGRGWVADYKTTGIAMDEFPRHAANMGYHRQAGWYSLGYRAAFGVPLDSYIMPVVSNKPPHEREVFAMDPEDIERGQKEAILLAGDVLICDEAGEYPLGRNDITTLSLPRWKRRQIDDRTG